MYFEQTAILSRIKYRDDLTICVFNSSCTFTLEHQTSVPQTFNPKPKHTAQCELQDSKIYEATMDWVCGYEEGHKE